MVSALSVQTSKSLCFDGTSTYVDLGPASSFDFSGDFTIEMHCSLSYSTSTNREMPLLGVGAAGTAAELAAGKSLVLRGSTEFTLAAQIAGGPVVRGVSDIFSSFRHVALRYTKTTQEIALFVNGQLEVASVACGAFSPDAASRVMVGRSSLTPAYVWGRITEVRIFRSARTERQIKANLFRRLTGKEDDLVSYFPLDGRSSDVMTVDTEVRDAKVLLDPVTLAPLATTRSSGTLVNCGGWSNTDSYGYLRLRAPDDPSTSVLVGEFDGARSHIKVPHDTQLTPPQLAVHAWVRPTGTGRPYYTFPVVSKHGPTQGWELRAGGGRCGFLIAVNGVYHDLNVPIDNDIWQAITGSFDGTTMTLRINGVLRASKSVSGTITPFAGDMNIGRNPYWTGHCFAGQIGQVHLLKSSFTPNLLHILTIGNVAGYIPDAFPSTLAAYHLEGDAKNYATNYLASFAGTQQDVRWVDSAAPFFRYVTTAADTTPYTDLDTTLALSVALETQRAALQSQLDDEKRAHADTTAQTVALGNQLNSLTQTRDMLMGRIAFLETLPGEIATQEAAIAPLEAEVQQLKAPRGQISLADFVKKAHAEVQSARAALAAKGGGYAFARMNLEVKMLPAHDGANMLFPELSDVQAIGADKLSTLNIGFEANESRVVTAAQVEVPSVLGTTETLAKRILAARELIPETSYQAIATSGSSNITEADRVVTQYPKEGSMVPAGSKVTIFLGREA